MNRYQKKKKKMAYAHFKTWLCVKNSVLEKNKRRLTEGTMMVNEIKSKKVQKMKRSDGVNMTRNLS